MAPLFWHVWPVAHVVEQASDSTAVAGFTRALPVPQPMHKEAPAPLYSSAPQVVQGTATPDVPAGHKHEYLQDAATVLVSRTDDVGVNVLM